MKDNLIKKYYENAMETISEACATYDEEGVNHDDLISKIIQSSMEGLCLELELIFSNEYLRKTEEKFLEILALKDKMIEVAMAYQPKMGTPVKLHMLVASTLPDLTTLVNKEMPCRIVSVERRQESITKGELFYAFIEKMEV